MTSDTKQPGEYQAQRLETAVAQMSVLLSTPENSQRLRARRSENEWTVLQTLGHCIEMMPFWLAQSRSIIDANDAEQVVIGRTLDAPSRLSGPARGETLEWDVLLAQLQEEARSAAQIIRALTAEERLKQGSHPRNGVMSVENIVENFVVTHLEEHVKQIQECLTP